MLKYCNRRSDRKTNAIHFSSSSVASEYDSLVEMLLPQQQLCGHDKNNKRLFTIWESKVSILRETVVFFTLTFIWFLML